MKSPLLSLTELNISLNLNKSWILLLCVSKVVQSFSTEELTGSKTCDFIEESKYHSVSDFLRCTDLLASDHPVPTEKKFSEILDRILERQKSVSRSSGRQGYGFNGYPYDQRPGLPNYRPGRPILDPSGGGGYGFNQYPDYPGSYGPSGPFNSGLIEALNSISQYDDLRCVPRLLCEIATGSKPGNGDYKASTLQDFGKNTLLGLLTAYNFEGTSPVLAFGKAALLGYTSQGDSSVCYREYVRCPRDPRDLVYYLNNHNGGFFRFFQNSRRTPAVAQGSNRVGFAMKEPAPPPGLSGPESDRTGTGELKFDNPELSKRQDDEERVLHSPNAGFSKVVFPVDDNTRFEDQSEPSRHRISKSLKYSSFFPAFSQSVTESSNSQSGFFPSDDYHEHFEKTNVVFESGEDLTEENYSSDLRKQRLVVTDQENQVSIVTFPDQSEEVRFDSGISKIFPLD